MGVLRKGARPWTKPWSHAAVCGWGRRTKGLGSEGGENKPGPGLHKYLSTKLFHNVMNRIR